VSVRIAWGQDLGKGYIAYPLGDPEDPLGVELDGPAGSNCSHEGGHDGVKGRCSGTVWFEGRSLEGPNQTGAEWIVEQEDPLTLSPSIECDCGFQHSYIVDGRWQ
jgi:hypothetical protein